MASSLSTLFINLADEIHKIKRTYEHNYKKCKNSIIKYKDYDCFLEYINFKEDLIEYNCLCCNKNYKWNFMKT